MLTPCNIAPVADCPPLPEALLEVVLLLKDGAHQVALLDDLTHLDAVDLAILQETEKEICVGDPLPADFNPPVECCTWKVTVIQSVELLCYTLKAGTEDLNARDNFNYEINFKGCLHLL